LIHARDLESPWLRHDREHHRHRLIVSGTLTYAVHPISRSTSIEEAESMSTEAKILKAGQAREGWLGGLGIRFMISGTESGGGFALIEHVLKPRALAAPLHRHAHEDEYSFVLQGRLGAKLGEEIVFAEPGDLICKPREQWHTFWNATDEETRLLEIISPPGFDRYFEEMVKISAGGRPDPELAAPIRERHGLEVDMSSVPKLTAEHNVTFG
jgi:mannose-6-phosphate isomerase-like protein (cupin superfamily)